MLQVSRVVDIGRLLRMAESFEHAGKLAEARDTLKRAYAAQPRNTLVLTRLGLISTRMEDFPAAEAHFEAAVKANPKSPELRNNLAMLLLHVHRPDKAEPHARQSLVLDKSSAETLRILAKCAFQLGHPAEAITHLERALEIKPGDPDLTLEFAQTLDMSGDPGRAGALYRELIAAGHSTVFAYDGLARLQAFDVEPPEYGEMARLLAENRLSVRHQKWLHGALGKIDQDLGRFDRAFAHFAALRSPERATEYVRRFADTVARAKALFTPAFFAERKEHGDPSKRPVFVFGMPRSGTTLTEQILCSHPEIEGANELSFFRIALVETFPRDQGNERFAEAVRAWPFRPARALGRDYLRLLAAHSDEATHVVDKMPSNFQHLWLLALLFPNATFVHCRRNPIATCVSCFVQPLDDVNRYTDDLAALGRYYGLYRELMEHWHSVLPMRIFDVDYDALVSDPEPHVRGLIAHVGVPWDEACLQPHQVKRVVRTPSRRQVEAPIHGRAREAWRRYEAHLGPLIAALQEAGALADKQKGAA